MNGIPTEKLVQPPAGDIAPGIAASETCSEGLLEETTELDLPNLIETVRTAHELSLGTRNSLRPFSVRPPIPGRYTTRPGERLSRRELMGAVDEWLAQTDDQTRFVIQGGNRYITAYASEVYDCTIPDLKIMSVEKAPLSVQLLTILSADERRALLGKEQLEKVIPLLPQDIAASAQSMTRAELLQAAAGFSLQGPFSPATSDEHLQEELSVASARINSGITIPNQAAISALMNGTAVADALRRDEPIQFLDDLFYRGRTLYSLAILMTACGGNPMNMRLTTLSSDIKSIGLESPFHNILRGGVLYPFENSIRTEQGYWQDVGTHYVFTDMGAYWEHLHSVVDPDQSRNKYSEWQSAMQGWSEQHLAGLPDGLDMSLVGPLLWLSVYHRQFGLELDINRIVDQKGYKIGACVPFAQLIDRFISQEEPVESRSQFKGQIRRTLSAIENAAAMDPDGFQSLVELYGDNRQALDYQGLGFMTEQDIQHITLTGDEKNPVSLVADVAESVAAQALDSERPLVVGVNGVDGSGKTMLTAELHRQLEAHGLPVTVVHIDDFTQPRTRRSAAGDPIERYYNNTFDIDTLRRAILEPLAARKLGSVILRHEDPRDSSRMVEHGYSFAGSPSVVIVEGVFVFRPELVDYFDTKIFVDIPLSEIRERAIERDVPRFGFGVLKKYLTKYIPTQAHYLDTVRPYELADIVIDNTDWHNPYIVKRGAADAQQTTT